MLIPSEIENKQFKAGLGYDKKEVEQFLHELTSDFDSLIHENEDLKKKLKDLNDSLSYYKSIERTLQRALILAEKAAQDTRSTALREADVIEMEAKTKARQILTDAKGQIEIIEHKALNLMQQYDMFKIQFDNLLHSQMELLNSKSFSIDTEEFSYQEKSENNRTTSEIIEAEELQKSLAAIAKDTDSIISDQEDINQIHFDFLDDTPGEKSYETEDGFEFITVRP